MMFVIKSFRATPHFVIPTVEYEEKAVEFSIFFEAKNDLCTRSQINTMNIQFLTTCRLILLCIKIYV